MSLNAVENADFDSLDEGKRLIMEQFDREVKRKAGILEKVILFGILILMIFVIQFIPSFFREYDEVNQRELPFSYMVDGFFGGSARYFGCFSLLILTYFITKANGSRSFVIIMALSMLFSDRYLSYITSCSSISIPFFCISLAICLSHNLLLNDPYGYVWFFYYIMCSILCSIAIYFRAEFIAPSFGCYVPVFISSLSRFGETNGVKIKLFIEVFLLIFVTYVVFIPLFYMLTYIREISLHNPIYSRSLNYGRLALDLFEQSDVSLFIILLLSVPLICFVKHRYISIVPILQLFISIILSSTLKYSSSLKYNTCRIMILEMQCFAVSSIIISKSTASYLNYALSLIFLGLMVRGKVSYMIGVLFQSTEEKLKMIREEGYGNYNFDEVKKMMSLVQENRKKISSQPNIESTL